MKKKYVWCPMASAYEVSEAEASSGIRMVSNCGSGPHVAASTEQNSCASPSRRCVIWRGAVIWPLWIRPITKMRDESPGVWTIPAERGRGIATSMFCFYLHIWFCLYGEMRESCHFISDIFRVTFRIEIWIKWCTSA